MKKLVRTGDDGSNGECKMQDPIRLPRRILCDCAFRPANESALHVCADCLCHTTTPFGRAKFAPIYYGAGWSENVTRHKEKYFL
jgi:hypothetical protein